MNTFELKIWDDEAQRCTFYTVLQDEADENETDRFFSKYEDHPTYSDAVQILLSFILNTIGDDYGAADTLFNRHENEVKGLPTKGKVWMDEVLFHFPDFPIRLYALRITNEIVVLFNGGIKDGDTNQTSSLHMQWVEACQFAKRITEQVQQGEILIDTTQRKLTNRKGGDEIIL